MFSAPRKPSRRAFRGAAAALLLPVLLWAGCGDGSEAGSGCLDLISEVPGFQVLEPEGTGAGEGLPMEVPVASWGFEDDPGTGWRVQVNAGRARGGVSREAARSGVRSLSLAAGPEGADADLQTHVLVKPSTEYVLEGYIRTQGLKVLGARVHGTFYIGEFSYQRGDNRDANDPVLWHRALPPLAGTTEGWRKVRYDFRTRPETRMLRIAASLGNWGAATGRIAVDDVHLAEIATPPDLTAAGWEGDGEAAVPVVEAVVGGELRRAIPAYPRSAYRFELVAPEGSWLSFGAGVLDRGLLQKGDGVLFQVEAEAGGRRDLLFSRHIDPAASGRDSAWFDARISLAPYGGRRVGLVFRTLPSLDSVPPDHRGDWAAWSAPRVFVPRDEEDRRREPDLVLITVDALRPDHLGCYGYERDTSPAIDALARDGVVFDNAFTTVPRTGPAVASMLTGLYPREHGVRRVWDRLGPDPATLAELLREEGYATGAVVTHNLHHLSGIHRGFDTYQDNGPHTVDSPLSGAARLGDMAADWVARHRGTKFFFWLHIWDPHFLYWPPEPYRSWFDPEMPDPLPLYVRLARGEIGRGQVYFENDLTDQEVHRVIALYDGEIRYADEAIGRFLARLRSLGLYDTTMVVLSSDHGESLGEQDYFFEHGEYLYDSTLRIPLIVKYPASRHAGGRVGGNALIMDIMPTIMGAADAPIPPVDGRDLSLFLDGGEPHPFCYAMTAANLFPENPRRHLPGTAGNWRSVRAGAWKLIEIPRPGGNGWELYDTASDPGETRNLYRVDDPVAADLRERLEEWNRSLEEAPGPDERPGPDAEMLERLRSLGYAD